MILAIAASVVLGMLGSRGARATSSEEKRDPPPDTGGCFSVADDPDASAFATQKEKEAARWRREYYLSHPPPKEPSEPAGEPGTEPKK
jgi:hypothetical protein